MITWNFYKEVIEGERVWRSYRADATLGTLYKETINYLDRSTGLVKLVSEASGFVAAPDAALTWTKEDEFVRDEMKTETYSATVAGGKMYLTLISYTDHASGLIKANAASMQLVSTTDIGGVESVNGAAGVVVLDTDDVAEGSTNLYYTDARADDRADARIDADILFFDSAPSVGGGGSETLAVTGLLATDVILAVSQKTEGALGTAMTGWDNQDDDALDISWTADPGAGAVVRVAVKRIP